MTLARSAQLDRDSHGSYIWDDHTVEERRRCYWSIILLHHTIGEPLPGPLPLVLRRSKPQFPASAPSPPSDVLNPEGRMVASLEVPTQEHGICFVVIQLSEAWSMAQCYIRNRGRAADGSPERLPPWHKSSQYSSTLELVMNLGDSLPPAHRYRFIHLTKVDSEELRQSRDYWAPWLLSRLLYHTTLCILNHPILIMLQIQGNRDISEVFLHQTTSARMHHSSWLMHFIQFMYNRDFYVSDPIFGYCAAVLATIELHQCFVEGHKQTATRRRQNFTHCVDFVGKLSDRWPYMQNAAESLHQLMETTAELCRKNAGNPNANKVRVDISGFLRILDFTQFCSPVNSTSPFGPTLVAHQLDPRPQVSPESTLEQLPAITEIDRQTGPPASPPALAPQVDRAPTTNSWNLPSQVSDSSLLPQLTGVFDEYTSLQADQLFGTLYDCMAPWDTVPAHAPAF
ncbi:hypothetical protein BDW74DRAFT_174783 [Aspergillus multicolor]|uniref:fungal specific transcription factor domain-containing protein n=1 Tax=Aspergillus multicolor TaxID=41759 RepID=UPI003CCD5BA0